LAGGEQGAEAELAVGIALCRRLAEILDGFVARIGLVENFCDGGLRLGMAGIGGPPQQRHGGNQVADGIAFGAGGVILGGAGAGEPGSERAKSGKNGGGGEYLAKRLHRWGSPFY